MAVAYSKLVNNNWLHIVVAVAIDIEYYIDMDVLLGFNY